MIASKVKKNLFGDKLSPGIGVVEIYSLVTSSVILHFTHNSIIKQSVQAHTGQLHPKLYKLNFYLMLLSK